LAPVHEFFRVGRLVPMEQEIVTVQVGTSVADALDLMRKRGFDQLPVMKSSRVLGVFSYRSLAENLPLIRAQDDPMKACVEDFLEELDFVRPPTELAAILTAIEAKGAVLVGSEDDLLAVATATDVSNFLWEASRPFLLLQDIELATRSLMALACREPSELARCLRAATIPEEVTRLEDLTLGDLLNVLTNGENYGRTFNRSFGGQRTLAQAQLVPVRDIRNKILHFRDDVSLDELNQLVEARVWLARKVAAAS
jgi:CBS domain-containing protein